MIHYICIRNAFPKIHAQRQKPLTSRLELCHISHSEMHTSRTMSQFVCSSIDVSLCVTAATYM